MICWYLLVLSAVIAISTAAFLSCDSSHTFEQDKGLTENNPMRGFVRYAGDSSSTFPHSMEYSYFAMKDLMTGENVFDNAPIEAALEAAKERGNQFIFRVYVDYPDCCPDGTYNTGVPDFLQTGDNSVTFTAYSNHGGGQSPDYSNERLITAMERLVAHLGSHYDGDRRIAFIKLGLLGFWGEWHCYPKDNLMASTSVMNRILAAYDNAFKTTRLMVSADQLQYWDSDSVSPILQTSIGWHDDNFAEATYDPSNQLDWYFYPRLTARSAENQWKHNVIGGEVQPGIQDTVFQDPSPNQDFTACTENTHVSWLLDENLFTTGPDVKTLRAEQKALKMGYRFHIYSVVYAEPSTCPESYKKATQKMTTQDKFCTSVAVKICNEGNAPPYVPFKLNVYHGGVAVEFADLKGFLPDTCETYTKVMSFDAAEEGKLEILIESEYTIGNIKFGTKQVSSSGALVVGIEDVCKVSQAAAGSAASLLVASALSLLALFLLV